MFEVFFSFFLSLLKIVCYCVVVPAVVWYCVSVFTFGHLWLLAAHKPNKDFAGEVAIQFTIRIQEFLKNDSLFTIATPIDSQEENATVLGGGTHSVECSLI